MSFFRINMPYGISKNEDGEWMVFNRLYLPLGYSKQPTEDMSSDDFWHVLERKSIGIPVYQKYRGLSETFLLKLAATETSLKRDDKGKISVVWFYNDATNPNNTHNYKGYWRKLQMLAEKNIKREI